MDVVAVFFLSLLFVSAMVVCFWIGKQTDKEDSITPAMLEISRSLMASIEALSMTLDIQQAQIKDINSRLTEIESSGDARFTA